MAKGQDSKKAVKTAGKTLKEKREEKKLKKADKQKQSKEAVFQDK